MNLDFFISKRIINAKENKNVLSGPIISIVIFAIALSVAIMIVSLSILEGFKSDITKRITSVTSHIQITELKTEKENNISPIVITDELMSVINSNNEITNTNEVIQEFGLVKTKTDFLGVNLKAVDSDYLLNWDEISLKGDFLISDSSIVISNNIANKLNLDVSDKINIYYPNYGSNRIKVSTFWICGIFSSSISEFDELLTYVSKEKLRVKKGWDINEISVLEIMIDDFKKLNQVKRYLDLNLNQKYDKKISSVKDLNPEIFEWIKLQDINVNVIIILMLLVASVNIISSLLILILEKTHLIGILKALGANNWTIRKIFIYQSLYLSIKGIFIGNIIALLLLFIQKKYELISLDEKIYYMSNVPVSFDFLSFLFINIGTILLSILILIIPTIIITKISPIKSIEFE